MCTMYIYTPKTRPLPSTLENKIFTPRPAKHSEYIYFPKALGPYLVLGCTLPIAPGQRPTREPLLQVTGYLHHFYVKLFLGQGTEPVHLPGASHMRVRSGSALVVVASFLRITGRRYVIMTTHPNRRVGQCPVFKITQCTYVNYNKGIPPQ